MAVVVMAEVVVVLLGVKIHARKVRLVVILVMVVVVVVVVLVLRFVAFAAVEVEPGSRVSVRVFRFAGRRWRVDLDILAVVIAAVFYVAVVVGCCVREESLLVVLLTIFLKGGRRLPAMIIVDDGIFLFVAVMAVAMVPVDSGSWSSGCS